jgi:hypothetical protein
VERTFDILRIFLCAAVRADALTLPPGVRDGPEQFEGAVAFPQQHPPNRGEKLRSDPGVAHVADVLWAPWHSPDDLGPMPPIARGRNVHRADLSGQVFAVPPGTQCKKIIPVTVGWLAVALMTDGWSQEAVEPGFRAVQRIGSSAKLLNKLGCPDHGFENGVEEVAIFADAIDIGGNTDKFALRIEFDDVAFGLFDQTGPEQGEGLRGAIANPDASQLRGPGLKAKRVAFTRINAICASTVSLTSRSPTVIFRGPIFSRQIRMTDSRIAEKPRFACGVISSRMGNETTSAVLPPGAREKANSQAALRRP